ncbi:MAG: UDP-N-acetylmuramate dehydrogenase [Alysiella sp.]|uniref:UDP-N-acetylmuramate dehydrogenase n=1 Tax=Alysiella sp. TaxID=1872483 RepID=UPI0026DB75D3|nr:UDP-N-acetylmuramate dehydrogenase [Alysiella sp.]MDO4433175.1 UDP-N-acetylmuramate dehydrogenase [Alysiella sp.]
MLTLHKNVSLQAHTTFGLPAKAAFYGELTDETQLFDIIKLPEFQQHKVLWLGGGSNVVLLRDYPHLVIRLNNKGIREISRANGKVLLEVQAGEVWHEWVLYTLAIGAYGLENLSLIPGTVGASPVQNIGAYGVEVKERIESVRCFDLETQEFVVFSNADCQFAYRDSLFKQTGKGRYVITAVRFLLDEVFTPNLRYGDLEAVITQMCGNRKPTAQDVSAAVCQIRREKLPDPAVQGNVGSFYKNPIVSAQTAAALLAQYPNAPHYPQDNGNIKLAAAWLIEQCCLKGYRIGNAAVHDKQALVLINCGGATADDVLALSSHICHAVQQRFGIHLSPEPVWLPENPSFIVKT